MPTNITAASHGGSVPVTSISCPSDKETVEAADIRTPVAALLAECADIRTGTGGLNKKVAKAGDTMTGALILNAGATVASGQTLTADGATVAGSKTITGNTVFSGSSNTTISTGRKSFVRLRVTLSDASQTVDCTDGDRFTLSATNAAPRTITLDNTVVTPLGGETLTFFWNPGGAGGAGTQYTFQRDDGTVIATFVGAAAANTGAVSAEFEYVFGTGWKLGNHSGTPNEYVPPVPGPESWDSYGVVPGAGA